VRYKQTVIGVAWSTIRPLLTIVVFTLVFGKIARLPSGGVPYPILVFTAMLPWQFFSGILTDSSSSLLSNAHLIAKVYFPRLILPASSVIVSMVDFLISLIMFVILMIWYRFVPQWKVVFLPFFMLLAICGAVGLGLWLASLNVKYRDFKFIVPFIMQFGLYISPVGFSSNIIPHQWRLLYSLNPMVGVIDGFRWAILGGENRLQIFSLLFAMVIVFILLATGIWHFRKTECTFADVI
jgi:lipopolysaccharide transport system permease protein